MQTLFAVQALLPEGWSENVRIEIDTDGTIHSVIPDADSRNAECTAGPLIPGMPNLHSHAFQRAMAGRTQRGGPEQDDFWSWRQCMYRFTQRLNPDDIETIATQLYIEMLLAGYTSVAEFHYLHHDTNGHPYAEPAETSHRIIKATEQSGIRLTLLPVFYAHAGFGGTEALPAQRRFVCDIDCYARIFESLASNGHCMLGFAPHSLRAVTPDELNALLDLRASTAETAPVHIHVAEQSDEVQACLDWIGARPIEWLLDNALVDRHWCLVHATHMTDFEIKSLADRSAVVGLCPSTEADLGDGLFSAKSWHLAEGRYGIGSDSHVTVDPFAELRLFEYGQRLCAQSRNIASLETGESIGSMHYCAALEGGARAIGQAVGRIAPGYQADFIVLDTEESALTEQSGDGLIDSAIFGPCRRPVRDVMVAGRWQVRDGQHALAETSLARYRKTLNRLQSCS